MSPTSPADPSWVHDSVSRFEAPLMQYAQRLLGGDVEMARDVVQDTFLKLWQADRAAVDGHLAPWLYRVCRNRAVDVLRKAGRMQTLDARDADIPAAPAGPAETEPALAALAELPARQQEILRLKFQAGLSYREIGEVMDLTVSHVGVLIHTAIKALRGRLALATGAASQTSPSGSR